MMDQSNPYPAHPTRQRIELASRLGGRAAVPVWLAALVMALLSACNLNQQQTIIITATPDVTATFTPEPSATFTPTPPPTPTIDPALVLQTGDNYLMNGYFENAVSTYQTVLNQGAPPEYAAPAAFRLGQAALREGLFSNAVDALTGFITQYPQDSLLAQAYFLRGDAYLGLSQWNEAIADYQQYLAMRPGLIDSYADERIADAQLALGQSEAAFTNYTKAIAADRTQVPLLALREKVAQVYRSAGRTADAVAQYDAILEVARNAPYRASIEFDAAQALLDGGDEVNGLARMQTVFDDYVGTNPAYDAMQVLMAHEVELDDLAVGRVSFQYGDYERAIDALNRFSTEHTLDAIPAELPLMLGRAYREIGNPAAALTAFRSVIDQYPKDPLFGDALLEKGRTLFLQGDIPGAITEYLSIADTYGYLTSTAAEALWRAGYLYGTNGSPEDSLQTFERLASDYPDTDQARSGLFLAASAAYKLNQAARAEQLYARLASTATGEAQAEAYLWVGRLAMQRGDQTTAQETLRLAMSASPDSYFSARAQDLVNSRAPFTPPAHYKFQFDDLAEISTTEDWLRKTFSVQQEGALWALSPTLDADPRLIRGRELWAVGANDAAVEEFSDLLAAYQNDGLASYQLAIALRSLGAYQSSVVAAANVIKLAGVATLDAPPYLARMRYPIYYLDVILKISQQWEIDPLLVFSLVRLESLFDTYATGAAGEKGLTQVIPSTAEYIATQLQWPNYKHSDLFRPYAGITFGAYYLKEQLDRFAPNVPAALAGYNAGPGRALDWESLSGGDPDLFMTTITIDSTRTYVQRMYGFYDIYRALYSEA